MRSRRQTGAFALWTVVALVSSQVLGMLVVLAGAGAVGFVTGWVIGTGAGTLGSLVVVRPSSAVAPSPATHFAESLRIGLPSAAYATVLTSMSYIDGSCSRRCYGPGAASGRYQLAYTVGGVTSPRSARSTSRGDRGPAFLPLGNAFLDETTIESRSAWWSSWAPGSPSHQSASPSSPPPVTTAGDHHGRLPAASAGRAAGRAVLAGPLAHLARRLAALVPCRRPSRACSTWREPRARPGPPAGGPPLVAIVSFSVLALVLTWLARAPAMGSAVPPVVWVATAIVAVAVGVAGAWATNGTSRS